MSIEPRVEIISGVQPEAYAGQRKKEFQPPSYAEQLKALVASKANIRATVTMAEEGEKEEDGRVYVALGDFRGIIPRAELDTRPVKTLVPFIGRTIACKVLGVDEDNKLAVCSRKAALEEMGTLTLERVAVGDILTGVVTHVSEYGVYVDVGGVSGLVPLAEVAYHFVDDPRTVVQPGDYIDVMVLAINHETKKLRLSIKKTLPDPWETLAERYKVGTQVLGVITGRIPTAYFVQLESGVDALAALPRRFTPERGDKVALEIKRIDPEKKRIFAVILRKVQP